MFFGSLEKSQSAPPVSSPEFQGNPMENKYGEYFLSMAINEKRKLYRCGDEYLKLDDIPPWPALNLVQPFKPSTGSKKKMSKADRDHENEIFDVSQQINNKVSLWQGDITRFEIDAIVNAANQSLLGGGGVDGSIHRGAGRSLVEECRLLHGCHTGQAKITSGHKLPAKYVIHTVGPVGKSPQKLHSCYKESLLLARQFKIRSLAFCCISTGVYGYPNRDAAYVALSAVRRFLEKHYQEFDRIIFCTYLSQDFEIYKELMSTKYFPCTTPIKPGIEDDDRFSEGGDILRRDERLSLDVYEGAASMDFQNNQKSKPYFDSGDSTKPGKLNLTDENPKEKNVDHLSAEMSDDEGLNDIENMSACNTNLHHDEDQVSKKTLHEDFETSELVVCTDNFPEVPDTEPGCSSGIISDSKTIEQIDNTDNSKPISVTVASSATEDQITFHASKGNEETASKKQESACEKQETASDEQETASEKKKAKKQSKLTDFFK